VQEKADGSLIKLWHHNGEWHVSSNGEIDARNARVNSALLISERQRNFYDLFMDAWARTGVEMSSLDVNYTYLFELVSPHNRIVVKYHDTRIFHIGTRDNRTLSECDMNIGAVKPRTFPLRTLDECIASAKGLGCDREGYVVVDKRYNRVKIKSPLYVALNHLIQGTTTCSNIVSIIQSGEQGEFLSYFPEYSSVFNEITEKIESFVQRQEVLFAGIASGTYETRKELASIVTKTECPACLFSLIDGKKHSAHDWLLSQPANKVLSLI
jgi:hypothetical protein